MKSEQPNEQESRKRSQITITLSPVVRKIIDNVQAHRPDQTLSIIVHRALTLLIFLETLHRAAGANAVAAFVDYTQQRFDVFGWDDEVTLEMLKDLLDGKTVYPVPGGRPVNIHKPPMETIQQQIGRAILKANDPDLVITRIHDGKRIDLPIGDPARVAHCIEDGGVVEYFQDILPILPMARQEDFETAELPPGRDDNDVYETERRDADAITPEPPTDSHDNDCHN